MLHVLFLLLRILGWLLLAVLLLVLLVLWCPVRYRADLAFDTRKQEDTAGMVGLSWLARLLSLEIRFQKEKTKTITLRLFGIPLGKGKAKRDRPPKRTGKREPAKKEREAVGQSGEEEPKGEYKQADLNQEMTSQEKDTGTEEKEKQKETSEPVERGRWARIGGGLGKVKRTAEFMQMPQVGTVFALLAHTGKRLLLHAFPKKAQGEVTFGMEDPSQTGKILAALGATLPLHRNAIAVHPLFEVEESQAMGQVKASGRIYLGFVVALLVRIALSRDVWQLLHMRRKYTGK